LQEQRREEGHGPAAQAREQVAGQADRKCGNAHQRRAEQGLRHARGVQPVAGRRSQATDQQQHRRRHADRMLAEALQRQRHHHQTRREHHEAAQVKTLAHGAAQVGHVAQRHRHADHAHRQVDQEHPVPGGHLHQPAAQRRPDQRPDQARQRDEGERLEQLASREAAQDRQPPDRQQQRPTEALHDARADQHGERRRQRAQQRTQAEQHDRADEDAPRAEAVGEPARGRDQQRHREHVGDDHRLHAQRALAQAGRHGRQRGVEDGAVQRLHEERDGHEPRQQAFGSGVEGH
jgi:hypothetical protein